MTCVCVLMCVCTCVYFTFRSVTQVSVFSACACFTFRSVTQVNMFSAFHVLLIMIQMCHYYQECLEASLFFFSFYNLSLCLFDSPYYNLYC